jgi:membrane protein YqaA with SNARE-associated domain
VLEIGEHTKDTTHHRVIRKWVTVLFHALTVLGELPCSIRGIARVNVAAHFFLSVVLTM